MTKFAFVQGFSIVAMVLVGCGGGEGDDGGGRSPSPPTTSTTPTLPGSGTSAPRPAPAPSAEAPLLCSVKGDKGNNLAVGAYCEKGAGSCSTDNFCTADFVKAPEGANFCTRFCSKDADCGEGATCYKETRGSACVLKKCLPQ
jgi:hypothetical protein